MLPDPREMVRISAYNVLHTAKSVRRRLTRGTEERVLISEKGSVIESGLEGIEMLTKDPEGKGERDRGAWT